MILALRQQRPRPMPYRHASYRRGTWWDASLASFTLTYDPILNRVIINCVGLGAATTAVISRSTDLVTWTVVRGGGNVVITSGVMAQLSDYEFVNGVVNYYKLDPNTGTDQVASITPAFTQLWLKSVARPFLNMAFDIHEIVGPIRRQARDGVFPIVGRTKPVAVTDVRLGREYPLRLMTDTKERMKDLDLLLTSGDVLFIHPPLTWMIDGAEYFVPDSVEQELIWTTEWTRWTIAVREVAAVSSDVVGSTATWQTVINTYATWADVLAAHSTWASVQTLIGDPSEVIVP